jgi:glycosyltransferase involved in cell wall biosynthesis
MEPLSKGLFDLVPVLRRVEKMGVQLSLRIAGGRHRVLEARFMRQRLDHLVTWMGIVPHEECYRLAAESDMLLMTSRREPFGMVTIEAMAMGCVPIAYDIPSGNREIIEHWRSGLLLPLGDFEAWANSIKSLDEDRHLLSKMSEAAVARARSNFNADKLAQGISNLIRAVKLNSAKDPPRRYVGAPGPRTAAAISYSRLPAWFRQWIRNTVSNHPYLSWWWLNQL